MNRNRSRSIPGGVVDRRLLFALALGVSLSSGAALRADGGSGGHGGSGGGGGSNDPLPPLVVNEVRTIDGSDNSLVDPLRGAAETPFRRLVPPAYADGAGSPSGSSRPSARAISNAVCAPVGSIQNTVDASDFVWQWGQFLDHDVDETPLIDPAEPFDIPVPFGDPFFDPALTGLETIPLDRSFYEIHAGVREQVNALTAFIDASQVYGSDEARALELRALDGSGKLRTSAGDLLPFNTNAFPNGPSAFDPSFFLAGDIRANEQVGLTAMHTLFVREHNRWTEIFADEDPSLSGEELYQRARVVVGAEMQAITFREFLPVLLGDGMIAPYVGYDPNVDPGIANEFATACYRVGHTMLSPQLRRIAWHGGTAGEGDLPLQQAFFAPQEIVDHGISTLLRGLAQQRAQQVDPFIVDDVRNFLFGSPGAGGLDLASLNIQRGRDHGLPSYAAVRSALGLAPVTAFADVSSDPEIVSRLSSVYGAVDEIDLWVGGLCEDHLPGAMVGETIATVLAEQFTALRDGDRFWYENQLSDEWQQIVESHTLGKIIRRNTSIGNECGDDVFRVSAGKDFVRGDCDGSGAMSISDPIAALMGLFAGGPMECHDACDSDDDGSVTISDPIYSLIGLFGGGSMPVAPYPDCGKDTTADALECAVGSGGGGTFWGACP